jgi:Flp pilus assembly protein TadB
LENAADDLSLQRLWLLSDERKRRTRRQLQETDLADHTHSEDRRGDMDIHEQASTYRAVNTLIKWCCLALASGLVFPILWLCTPAGPVAGFVVAALIAVLGVVFLRDKPAADH